MAEANAVVVIDEESLQVSQLVGSRVQPLLCTPCFEDFKSGDVEKKKKPATTLSERFYFFVKILSKKLGLEEFTSLRTWQASFAEFLGMIALIFAMDTIVVGTLETEKESPILVMSFLMAATLSIMLLAVFPVSGGHLNPVISFTAGLLGLISMSRAFLYIVAQSIGAVLGALAFKAVISREIDDNFALGGCTLSVVTQGPNGPITVGIGTDQALCLEILGTFVVIFAACGIGFNRSGILGPKPVFMFSIIGTMVGLMTYVTSTVTTVQGYAGAGMNPARCIGPAIVRGGLLWDRHWIFWVGPAIAALGFYVYTMVIPTETFFPQDSARLGR
ncbi:probable aquaporin TIP3-1 [Telopea speciosissima]|uniref:probable aquaporin TIP3-1 n=1 Tax=Telopea speciosissima TaxID=54955 RepID=UPI001CC73470|nr:probable aquaporin TIP3-1 [Telopea speciosissima]